MRVSDLDGRRGVGFILKLMVDQNWKLHAIWYSFDLLATFLVRGDLEFICQILVKLYEIAILLSTVFLVREQSFFCPIDML